MRILEGQQAFRDAINRSGGGESNFLKLEDGETVTIRFVQEFDESGSNYSEDRGKVFGTFEHIDPDDFTKSFACTAEDGRCAGCEKVAVNYKWRPKGRLFANVIVRGGRGNEDKVKVFSTSLSKRNPLAGAILEFNDEYKSLCDRDYKLKREGLKLDTVYTLTPKDKTPLTKADEKVELVDLTNLVKRLSYDEQKELLGDDNEDW